MMWVSVNSYYDIKHQSGSWHASTEDSQNCLSVMKRSIRSDLAHTEKTRTRSLRRGPHIYPPPPHIRGTLFAFLIECSCTGVMHEGLVT